MLGSLHDAEDALQDAMLRAWRGLRRARGPPRAAGLALRDRHQRAASTSARAGSACSRSTTGRRAVPGRRRRAAGRGVWVEPYPDAQIGLGDGYASPEARYERREAVELAFIAALQHLPGRQRAVLILRDVLGFSAKEVAEMRRLDDRRR